MNTQTTSIADRAAGPAPTVAGTVTIAVFQTAAEAEAAVTRLQRGGFDMTQLSIVGTDYQTDAHVVGFYTTGARMRAWGAAGAFWGGIWGLLWGAALFVVPGVGPVLVAGPFIAALAGAAEGAMVFGGISALGAGLISLGIPKNSVLEYETAIKAGNYLLIAHGTPDALDSAKRILARN